MLLNCDLGEGFGVWKMGMDEAVMPLIDQANIACGFHASDPTIMSRAVGLAVANGVIIGAHPSYPDLVGFGRRSMACSNEELKTLIWYQVGALEAICRAHGAEVSYVKPHGALNNDMMKEESILVSVMEAVAKCQGMSLMLPITMHHRKHREMAADLKVPLMFEAFADRAYTEEGQLAPRYVAGSVYHDGDKILKQAISFTRDGGVTAINGKWLNLPADTLCIHGDNEASVTVARRIRKSLEDQG